MYLFSLRLSFLPKKLANYDKTSVYLWDMKRFNYKKAVQALNLLAVWSGGKMNKMKALKLIWLSDRAHLRKYGRPITQDRYVAMDNGPVASGTRDILQKNAMGVEDAALQYSSQFIASDGYNYTSVQEPVEKVFSQTDLEALKAVFDIYGHYDQFKLRDLTHEFPEWKKFEEGLKAQQYKVHPMDYNDFFLDAGEKHPLFNDDKKTLDLVHKLFSRK